MSPVIAVSIYVLRCSSRLDVDINIPNGSLSTMAEVQVFFGSIGGLLLIYVPGSYLQLVDCITGHNSEPTPNLCLGPELATPLPHQAMASTHVNAHITPLHAESHSGAKSDLRDHFFLDNRDGIVYEFTFDRNALMRVFDHSTPEAHVQALHLAIIHMHDSELVHRLMGHLCSSKPHVLTPELLHEYLLGVPYQKVKEKSMEPHLLELLPVSSIATYSSNRRAHLCVKYERTSTPITNANRRLLQQKKVPRFMVGKSKKSARMDFSHSGQSETSHFGRLIRLFGWGDDGGAMESSSSTLHDSGGHKGIDSEDRWQFVEALYDYMVQHFPKENKSKCMAWAKDFRREQIHACQVLFDYLKGMSASSSYARFQTMENFYFALEELQVPAPKDFNESFTELSAWQLPPSVFLQYVERGVFRITEPIVHKIFGELSCSPEDNEFKFALLTQLPQKGFIRCLRRYPENYLYLVDYFLSVMPVHFSQPQEVRTELLHQMNSSAFIPKDIFLANLAATQGIETVPPAVTRSASVPVMRSSAPPTIGTPPRGGDGSHHHHHRGSPTGKSNSKFHASPLSRVMARAENVTERLSGSHGSSSPATTYPRGVRTHAFVVDQISQSMKGALGVQDLDL